VAERVTVALFGGSFNPPHVGHVLSVTYARSVGLVEHVVCVPVFAHALGKQLAAFEHRVEMARLAFEWLPGVEVSRIEERLGTPSRTLDTIVALQTEHPNWELRLMVGSDILGELHQWHAFAEIARRAPPLVLPRAGTEASDVLPRLLPEVSSTDVRARLGAWALTSSPSAPLELEALVPRAVLAYVKAHGLYGVPAESAIQR
jgi:nicotinate-nucleotide adenylyltransferase